MNPTAKHQQEAREPERIWIAKRHGIGGHYEWQVYEREEHLGLLADEPPIKYVPASLLSSRDAEIRDVLESLKTGTCWCWDTSRAAGHEVGCEEAQVLWKKVNPDSTTDTRDQ